MGANKEKARMLLIRSQADVATGVAWSLQVFDFEAIKKLVHRKDSC
jgi:hypothetical protein